MIPSSTEAVFGTWALGGGYWGPQKHSDSVKAIHTALRAGVNHFDTAPVYGKGQAETLLGQQLRKIRNDVIIADKCFYKEPDDFLKSFHLSLKRLNTDYIDIFYIHWPQSGTDMRPVMELLENLRKEGRIKAIGVSNFNKEQMAQVLQAGIIDIAQMGYNLLWRKEEEELLPFCRKHNISTAAYSVLAQGILTGKFKELPQSEDFTWRKKMVLFDEELFPRIVEKVQELEKSVEKYHLTASEGAIFWTKENELINCSILGCRDRKQTEENLRAFSINPPHGLYEELTAISNSIREYIPREENIFRHKT